MGDGYEQRSEGGEMRRDGRMEARRKRGNKKEAERRKQGRKAKNNFRS